MVLLGMNNTRWETWGMAWVLSVVVLCLGAAVTATTATARRTGIVVHGCHCGAEGWERIVWGDPHAGALGRVPMALRLALRETDSCVVAILFGTGASEHPETGLLEGQATLALAKARCCRWSRVLRPTPCNRASEGHLLTRAFPRVL